MKKLRYILSTVIISLIAAIVIPSTVYCQPQQLKKNEISVEYSQFTIPQAVYLFGGIMGTAFTLGHFMFDNSKFTGAFAIEYNHIVNDWFSFGEFVSYEYMTSDTYNIDSEGNKVKTGDFTMSVGTILPAAHFHWFRNPGFGMYSKIGIGLGMMFSDDNSLFPAFQVSPVCIEFGNGSVKGLTELGFGTQGIVTIGVKKLL